MFNQWHFRESSNLNSIKLSAIMPDEIADTMVALANTNGGWLTNLSRDTQAVIIALARQCSPVIDIKIRTAPDKIIASIPRSNQIHATPDRRVLVRAKNQNVLLNGKQIRQLAQIRSVGDYEGEIVPGTSLNDLNSVLIKRFCDQLAVEGLTVDVNDILIHFGVLDSHQRPTVAGILLFGDSPQQWLPQSMVVIKRFAGKTSTKNVRLIQQQEVQGNLWTMLETLHHWVHGKVIHSTDTIELPSIYPASVVFEALNNAVIHREYRLRYNIQVNIYDDRLQIISPGEPPSFIKTDSLEQYRFYRNSTVAQLLSFGGYKQKVESGIEQMKAVAANRQIALQFTTSHNYMTVSIFPEDNTFIENAQTTMSAAINWRQERAIRYIQECGSLTYHEFQAICPSIAQQILFSDLVDLVEKKLVVKAGTKNVFFYLQHQ